MGGRKAVEGGPPRQHAPERGWRIAPAARIPGFCLADGAFLAVGNLFSSLSIV
jgi:hypothetical protein